MRPRRRPVHVEVLESRRLLNGSTFDFGTAAQTVSNASGSVDVTVFRTGDTNGDVYVRYDTADGSAHAGTQYTTTGGYLSFTTGQTEATISIPVADLPHAPASQTFSIALSSTSPGDGLGTTFTQTITLQNDRSPVTLASATASATTDDSGVDLTVTRDGNTTIPVTVAYATGDGTADAGTDYADTSGTLSFAAGQTSTTIHVPLLSNFHAVDGVTFGLALLDPQDGAVLIGTSSATVTINNNHSPVTLGAVSYAATTDDQDVTVTVTRDGNTSLAADVDYSTADGTATDGVDYVEATGTFHFAAGQTSKQFQIQVTGNVEASGDRDFTVSLGGYGGAAAAGAVTSAPVTISNAYSPVRFAAAGYSATTDDDSVTVTVHRTGNTSVTADVTYATADVTAEAGTDYTPVTGTLHFLAGETSKDIEVPLLHHVEAADGLQFQVGFTGGNGGAVLDSPAETTVTLSNGHVPVQLDASSYTFSTDDDTATIVVNRTGDLAQAVTVDYATSDGTAIDGVDYTAASGTLHFAAGETQETITVPLLHRYGADDGLVFSVALSNPAGGAELGAADSAPVHIANLHSLVELDAASYVVDVRLGAVTVGVVRTGNTSLPASVDYTTLDGTAVDGEDYFGTSGTLAFDAGETTAFIQVGVLGGAASPPSRGFDVVLSGPAGNAVTGSRDTAPVDVRNNQSLVQFSQAAYSVNADAGTATLTLTRVGNTTLPMTLDYATADGTALDGRDYTAGSGTVSFAANQTSKTISVPVLVNAGGASATTFSVHLSNPSSAGVIGTTDDANVTVQNPHFVVQFDVGTLTVSNDDGVATLVVRRAGNTSVGGTVSYATFSDTAVAGEDYAVAAGVLTFAAGESTKSIQVPLLGNAAAGASRAFGVTLSGGTGGAVLGATTTAAVTVTNLHSVVSFDAVSYTAAEADGVVMFTLSRVGNVGRAVTVGYLTADGTAAAGSDYAGTAGTVTFDAGQSVATFTVAVNSDLVFDPGETFGVSLVDPAGGAVIGAASGATVTLADTTPPPTFAGGALVATAKAGRLDGVSIAFDQALDAPPASAFSLFQRSADLAGTAPRLKPVPVGAVDYDEATHAVTVKAGKALKGGVFYQLVVNPDLVHNLGGKALDGAGDGTAGSALVVTFGQGKRLKYVDHNGDTVQLAIKGPGVMQLTRTSNGEGDRLTLSGTTAATKLTGVVRTGRFGGDGQTMLNAIVGLAPATSLLTAEQFLVGAIA
jgi:hypothetical protein